MLSFRARHFSNEIRFASGIFGTRAGVRSRGEPPGDHHFSGGLTGQARGWVDAAPANPVTCARIPEGRLDWIQSFDFAGGRMSPRHCRGVWTDCLSRRSSL